LRPLRPRRARSRASRLPPPSPGARAPTPRGALRRSWLRRRAASWQAPAGAPQQAPQQAPAVPASQQPAQPQAQVPQPQAPQAQAPQPQAQAQQPRPAAAAAPPQVRPPACSPPPPSPKQRLWRCLARAGSRGAESTGAEWVCGAAAGRGRGCAERLGGGNDEVAHPDRRRHAGTASAGRRREEVSGVPENGSVALDKRRRRSAAPADRGATRRLGVPLRFAVRSGQRRVWLDPSSPFCRGNAREATDTEEQRNAAACKMCCALASSWHQVS